MTASRNILTTCALPYANGPLHLGHLLGYIQTDIWVRAQRMFGHNVHFVCADDAHGTPIMLAAEKAGMSAQAFIADIQKSHESDFAQFGIKFDHYHSTHSEENRQLATLIYSRLRDGNYIGKRTIQQLFDPIKQMFLPDRYIKGDCPNCGSTDQYGDNCEVCGKAYAPTDLKNPRSVMSGATPELRDSEHYFFEVGKFQTFLQEWLAGDVAHSSVKAKLKEWLHADGGLRAWDISRDAPYFGFEIPDTDGKKFFYVWLDAPIGYLASFKALCAKTDLDFDAYLKPDSTAELHHFIGKDIINFHGLFWPAMLHGAGFRVPTELHVNGYLTINGAKMSKSRGTFIQARTYLDAELNAEYLRYYFATMLGPEPSDLDLSFKSFEDLVNSHLVGKFVNIASRCAKLLDVHFSNSLVVDFWTTHASTDPYYIQDACVHLENATKILHEAITYYESGDFGKVTAKIMHIADMANEYIATTAPWSLAKDVTKRDQLHVVLSTGINLFRALACALKPILPTTVAAAERFLNLPGSHFAGFTDIEHHLSDHTIGSYNALITRIDPKQIETMIEASKESLSAAEKAFPSPQPSPASGRGCKSTASSSTPSPESRVPNSDAISIDDFAKLDLRIGKVIACEFVEGSDKLLRFELDAGELGKRQIFSGIRAAYGEPAKLIGQHVVFVANLAPRKMRFGVSEGMILSAGSGGADLFLLDVATGAQAGMPVK